MRGRVHLLLVLIAPIIAGCVAPPEGVSGSGLPLPAENLFDPVWDTTGDWSHVLKQGPLAVKAVEKLTVTSFDGTKLASAVWRPDLPLGERAPVILTISPYFENFLAEPDDWVSEFFLDNFVTNGYVYARAALRGTSESDGCMETMGVKEQRDVDEIVTFFGTQSWSNGNVAIIGKSYVGTTPWVAASFGNPHLKAIIPISGITSWAENGFRNGTSELRGPIHAELYWAWFGTGLITVGDPLNRRDHLAEQACPEVAEGFGASEWALATGETTGAGPFADYWKVRDFRERVAEKYRGAIYAVQGFQDFNVDATNIFPLVTDLNRSGLEAKMMLGQWKHDHPDQTAAHEHLRWDWAEMLLRWLDHHLKGMPEPEIPNVWTEDSAGLWRVEEAWPPRDAREKVLHLGGEAVLDENATAAGEAIAFNPGTAVESQRCSQTNGNGWIGNDPPTGWTFYAGPLDRELRFAGMPQLHITISAPSPHAILRAELWSVSKSLTAQELTHANMRLRFHDGGNTPDDFGPDESVLARMEFHPVDAVVPAGQRLALVVRPDTALDQCMNVGDYTSDLNKHMYPSPTPVPVTLKWGDGRSVLRLPVIERDVADGRYPGQPVAG